MKLKIEAFKHVLECPIEINIILDLFYKNYMMHSGFNTVYSFYRRSAQSRVWYGPEGTSLIFHVGLCYKFYFHREYS